MEGDTTMKKTVALLLMTILMISLIAPAFAGPVAQCPFCNGEYISTRPVGEWHTVYGKAYLTSDCSRYDGTYWEQRDVLIICSNDSHPSIEKRNFHTVKDVDPATWGFATMFN